MAGRQPAPQPPVTASGISWKEWALATLLAVGLTLIFWGPLWRGGGLVGGDLYSYYFPQKVYYADALQRGVIPLWNSLVGFGYPVLGESQTAALYPPNLLLYRVLSVNTAYNVSQLGHYIITFLATFGLARRLRLATAGALLAATAFTYGWFPPRICWEWAIIGGMYFSLILFALVDFLQTGRRRSAILMGLFLGLDLLAGHYNLAFITLLTIPAVVWLVVNRTTGETQTAPVINFRERLPVLSVVLMAGLLLGAMQWIPTWELKGRSQRQTEGDVFSATSGHLPPVAVSQLWMPWSWTAGEESMDSLLEKPSLLKLPDITNQVEAQLYVGLLPFLLALLGLLIPAWRRQLLLPRPWGWGVLILLSLLLASGWPTHWLSFLPGFSYFRGPGRYGIVAAFSLALLAGAALDAWLRSRTRSISPGWSGAVLAALLLSITVGDLWAASRQYKFGAAPFFGRQVFYATLVDDPPLNYLNDSLLRAGFRQQGGSTRLFAPGANMPTLLGVSALPVYLGLGPALYEDSDFVPNLQATDPQEVGRAAVHLREQGVTHLLLQEPLKPELWPVTLMSRPVDPVLNRCYARAEPFYLYALQDAPGRASFNSGHEGNRVALIDVFGNRARVEVEVRENDQLVLRDLNDPGWKLVEQPGVTVAESPPFRAAQVTANPAEPKQVIEWVYLPASVLRGGLASLVGIVLLLGIGRGWWPLSRWNNKTPVRSGETAR